MTEREAIEPTVWGDELEWYRKTRLSPAVRVDDLLFVAGCTGSSAGSPGEQMRSAYEEVGDVLAAAGASWNDVVAMTTYHVDLRRDIEQMTEIHHEFVVEEPFPAWTAVGVTQLYSPQAIVEIAVTALIPTGPDGDGG
ncbi:MAG TPA: Rid family hydrolase [Actinomycetota bacterium]|jgi:enamine deaminase RidA (YjgF/YER057c/UK114 family)